MWVYWDKDGKRIVHASDFTSRYGLPLASSSVIPTLGGLCNGGGCFFFLPAMLFWCLASAICDALTCGTLWLASMDFLTRPCHVYCYAVNPTMNEKEWPRTPTQACVGVLQLSLAICLQQHMRLIAILEVFSTLSIVVDISNHCCVPAKVSSSPA